MKELEYFIGKYCSIFTTQHSRDLYRENPKAYPKVVFQYFVGKVLTINKECVIIERAKGLRTCVFREQLVSIAEEELLDPNNPNDALVIQEMQRMKMERKPPPQVPVQQAFGGATMNPEALAQLAEDVKSKFGAT